MMQNDSKVNLENFLVILKSYQPLAEYDLSLYCKQQGEAAQHGAHIRLCCSILQNLSPDKIALSLSNKHIRAVFGNEKPAICRLHGGLLSFLVPFQSGDSLYCLVGEGVREESINILELKELSRNANIDVFDLLEKLEKLPVKTSKEVEEVAAKAKTMMHSLLERKNNQSVIENTRTQLQSITAGLMQMDELHSIDELITFTGNLLKNQFNASRIAVALRDVTSVVFQVKGICGLPEELGCLSEKQLSKFIAPTIIGKPTRFDAGCRVLMPAVSADHVTSFPLETKDAFNGLVIFFDCNLTPMDVQLVQLVTTRVAALLKQLKKKSELLPVSTLANNLLSLTNTLVVAESKEELYENVLEIAAELVGASRGSIMLIGKSGRSLHIGYCKGMNLQLARSISVRIGDGIAGRVARSGLPLRIDDIENDSRIGMRNRPRFKTKSLLSVPLKLKNKTIGVLNLSDKDDLGIFSEADLNLLATFANLASLMIERSWAIEKSNRLEQLSVTDHLTGLYNRRFLKSRLEEELNRSARYGLPLTVIFIDLDFFKIYNDLCGHLAGDRALQKTADIIKGGVRDMDIVARYGGEEFCIILPGAEKTESVLVAERIRQGIEKEKFPNEGSLPLGQLTASFGVASYPQDGHTFTTLIHSADMALYRAKAAGRNRIMLGQPATAVDHA
jgi:diguanylate cyclase (GGDEF)-like protein